MKVAVLLSGGLDSTTALHWALRHHEVVCALSFDYGSNHAARELACARWQAEHCGVPCHEIDLRSVSAHLESALLNGAEAIPTADYAEENMKQTCPSPPALPKVKEPPASSLQPTAATTPSTPTAGRNSWLPCPQLSRTAPTPTCRYSAPS